MTTRIFEGWPLPVVRADKTAYELPALDGSGQTPDGRSFTVVGKFHPPSFRADQAQITMSLGPIGSEGGTLEVWFSKTSADQILVRRGCFSGTLDEFADRAREHNMLHVRAQYLTVVAAIREIGRALAT